MKSSRQEAEFVIENILQALISGVRKEVQRGAKPPSPAALRAIMQDDLAARGWGLRRLDEGASE